MDTQEKPVNNPAQPANGPAPVVPRTTRQPESDANQHSVLHPLQVTTNKQVTSLKGKSMHKKQPIIIGFLVVFLGVISGYALAYNRTDIGSSGLMNEPGLQREVESGNISKGTKVGLADAETFKDSAEGQLEKGGIDGEGSHHLIRPGGESQTLYLTSSVIDLDQFVGRKVKIWGETMSSDKAAWFMDAGKLEVLE